MAKNAVEDLELVQELAKLYSNSMSLSPAEDVEDRITKMEAIFEKRFGRDYKRMTIKALNLALGHKEGSV